MNVQRGIFPLRQYLAHPALHHQDDDLLLNIYSSWPSDVMIIATRDHLDRLFFILLTLLKSEDQMQI